MAYRRRHFRAGSLTCTTAHTSTHSVERATLNVDASRRTGRERQRSHVTIRRTALAFIAATLTAEALTHEKQADRPSGGDIDGFARCNRVRLLRDGKPFATSCWHRAASGIVGRRAMTFAAEPLARAQDDLDARPSPPMHPRQPDYPIVIRRPVAGCVGRCIGHAVARREALGLRHWARALRKRQPLATGACRECAAGDRHGSPMAPRSVLAPPGAPSPFGEGKWEQTPPRLKNRGASARLKFPAAVHNGSACKPSTPTS